MAISDLIALVSPPKTTTQKGDKSRWAEVQAELGLKLPKDYYDYAVAYGSGSFLDRGRLQLTIYNPCSENYIDSIQEHNDILAGFKSGEGDDNIPYGLLGENPGLLAVGSDDNGNELYWLTRGRPNQWSIIVRSPENEFQEFSGPLTDFLCQVFTKKIDVNIWPSPFFSNPTDIAFQPKEDAPTAKVEPKNIYQLYVENGNQANFWVRRDGYQNGVRAHIREIEGKESGPLSGIPNEYGRPPIKGDLYVGDTLFEANTNLSSGYQRAYYFA